MGIQYLSDEKGQVLAVQFPIEEWELIKSTYPDVVHIGSKLPQWHEQLLDARLEAIENNPERKRPIDELIDELDK